MSTHAATIDDILSAASNALHASPSPRLDAELLLCKALARPRSYLYGHGDARPAIAARHAFDALLQRRMAGEPIAHLLGVREFWSLELAVDKATLIPRPATEALVAAALERLDANHDARVADLGTGSGAIALAIASERPRAQLVATDDSAAALSVAQHNARRLNINNVVFYPGDWCAALPAGERYDLIVSNPPYIAADDPHLDAGDLRFEPRSALVAGADGLDDIRAIAAGVRERLRDDGWLLLEHGFEQGAAVREIVTDAGLRDARTLRDLAGQPRLCVARR